MSKRSIPATDMAWPSPPQHGGIIHAFTHEPVERRNEKGTSLISNEISDVPFSFLFIFAFHAAGVAVAL
jgi:hypothetical protein